MSSLPSATDLVEHSRGRGCCTNPDVKSLLDELRALRDAGVPIFSVVKIHRAIMDAGYRVSRESITAHLKGECEPT